MPESPSLNGETSLSYHLAIYDGVPPIATVLILSASQGDSQYCRLATVCDGF